MIKPTLPGETWRTAERIADSSFQGWMHHKNEKESCDICIGMNTLKPDARTRTKDDIQTVRHLYLEIDHEGLAVFAKIKQSNLLPRLNYTINTSPEKFQVVWQVEDISREGAEAPLRAMARRFGGDPMATDSTRALPLLGFMNRKYETEFLVQALKHTDLVHHFRDFHLGPEPVDSDFRPRQYSPAPPSAEPRPRSHSEHDWAYAERALARGDGPAEIIRRIADYRASKKAGPLYYVRHTVIKAQADLRRRASRRIRINTATRINPRAGVMMKSSTQQRLGSHAYHQ